MKFLVLFFSVLCISGRFANGDLTEEEVSEITDTCCQEGERFAVSATAVQQCNDAPPPEDIEPEQTVICLAGLRSCCQQHFKQKDECSEGMTYSAANRCSVPTSSIGQTCCEECSFGRLTGESQGKEGCGGPAGDYVAPSTALRKNAYYKCCVEAAEKPTTTTQPPPPKTTTTPKPPKPKEKCQPGACDHQCHDEDGRIRCSCNEGYRLQKDNKSCKDINECAEAIDDLCTVEGTVCHNVPGTFKCVPLKKRDVSKACPPGFKKNVINQVCDDINECQSPRPPCPKYLCENTIGGYKCAGKPGKPFLETSPGKVDDSPDIPPPDKNDICPPGFRSGPTDECLDIDECEEHSDDCQRLSQFCINTHGSFFCQDHVSKRCAPGFVVNKSTGKCEDINECEESSEVCQRNEVCVNMPGAYTCKSKISTLPQLGTSAKECQEGTRPRSGGSGCEDIDECREGTHLCDQFQNCVNTFGGHECQCKNGFELDSSGSCVDIDECALKLDGCREGTYCLNVVGTFTCTRRPPTTTTTQKTNVDEPYYYYYYDEDDDNSTTPINNDTTPGRQPRPFTPPIQGKPGAATPKPPVTITTQQPTRPPYVQPITTSTTTKPYTNRPRYLPAFDSAGPERPSRPTYPGSGTVETPRRDYNVSDNPRKPVSEPPEVPRRAYVTTSTTPEVTPTPIRPVTPRRPTYRRPDPPPTEVTLPLPTEVSLPSPKDPVTIERDKNGYGSYDINTSDIPKDRWTNVIGKDKTETDFDPNELHCLNGYEKNAQGDCEDINECERDHICSAGEVCENRPGGYICVCKPGYSRDSTRWCKADNPPPPRTTSTTSTTTSTTTTAPTPPPPPSLPPRPEPEPSPEPEPRSEIPYAPRPQPEPRPEAPYHPRPQPEARPESPYLPRPQPEPRPPYVPRPRDRARPTNCELGYNYDPVRGKCVDIDECATNRARCSADEDCVNVEGGYRCTCGRRCRRPHTELRPSYAPPPAPPAVPPREVKPDSSVITVGAQYGQRGPRALRPTFTRMPQTGDIIAATCPWGYKLTPDKMCLDIDECALNASECGPRQRCENFYGGYSCQCPAGHKLDGAAGCADIDECLYGKPCPFNSQCINTVGSYRCSCGEGFRNAPSNEKVCVDIDECSETPEVCDQGCSNAWGGYRCYCKRGYRLSNDTRTCEDVDECAEWAAVRSRGRLCGGTCTNEPGSYRCSCPDGYRLSEDGRSCIDIDECENGQATCANSGAGEVCQNTRGGYHCHRIDCPRGYRLEAKHRCSRIQRSCPISDWNCLHQPSSYSYNFITFVANIYLPEGSVDLFTMHGPAWVDAMVTFEMSMIGVQAPRGVRPVDLSCFDMRPSNNICVISLLCSPEGPQVAELQLTMSLFQRRQFAGSAVARLVVIVSQYEF